MRIGQKTLDIVFLGVLFLMVIGLPLCIYWYDRHLWQAEVPSDAKRFTLTGHTQKGWILGEISAYEVVPLGLSSASVPQPVIRVSKGDRVVFKLKSSDVVHGFSLKDFGIFINDGIQPGKSVLVSFVADKAGTFTFSCNAICGDFHNNMQGTLIVTA